MKQNFSGDDRQGYCYKTGNGACIFGCVCVEGGAVAVVQPSVKNKPRCVRGMMRYKSYLHGSKYELHIFHPTIYGILWHNVYMFCCVRLCMYYSFCVFFFSLSTLK